MTTGYTHALPTATALGKQARFAGIEGEPESFDWQRRRESRKPKPNKPTPPPAQKSKEHWLFRYLPFMPVSLQPIMPHSTMEVGNLPTNLETRSAMWRHKIDVTELRQLHDSLTPLGYEANGTVDAIGMYDFLQAGLKIRRPLFLPNNLWPQRHTIKKLSGMIHDLFRNPTRFYVNNNDFAKARVTSTTLDSSHTTLLIGNEASIEVDQQARSIHSRHRQGDEWKAKGDLVHLPEPFDLDISGSPFNKPRVSLYVHRQDDGSLLLVNQSPTNEPIVTMSDGVQLKLATNSVPLATSLKVGQSPTQGLTHSIVLQHPNQLWRTNVMLPPVSALVHPTSTFMAPVHISFQPQRGVGENGQESDEAEWVVTVSPNKPGERKVKLKGEK